MSKIEKSEIKENKPLFEIKKETFSDDLFIDVENLLDNFYKKNKNITLANKNILVIN
jgi:hypothetical protein